MSIRTSSIDGHYFVSVTSAMKLVRTILSEPEEYYGPLASIHAAEGEGAHRICLDWLATQHGFLPKWEEPPMPAIHPDPERWNDVLTRCLFSFHQFCTQYQIEPIGIEQEDRSKTYGLIGHIDLPAFFTMPGRRRLKGPIDLKFTSTVQESHHLQVRCYGRLDGMKGSQLGGIFNCNRDTGKWKFIQVDLTKNLADVAAVSYAAKLWAWKERKQ